MAAPYDETSRYLHDAQVTTWGNFRQGQIFHIELYCVSQKIPRFFSDIFRKRFGFLVRILHAYYTWLHSRILFVFLVISFVLFDWVDIVCLFVCLSVCLFCLLANKRVHYTLLSTLDYKFLFNYLQLFRSYAILSATTIICSNVLHRLKGTLGGRT